MARIEPGQVFGKRTVVREMPKKENSYDRRWLVRCSCGAEHTVAEPELLRGHAGSCRTCSQKDPVRRAKVAKKHTTHGMAGLPAYRSWSHMIDRCTRTGAGDYERYGGRGITVCPEWAGPGGFERFITHVGPRPGKNYSIDRINNEGNYEPGNVRWATPVQQSRNKRNSRVIEHNGERLPLAAWAERAGIEATTIAVRLKMGWTVEAALTRPPDTRRQGRLKQKDLSPL